MSHTQLISQAQAEFLKVYGQAPEIVAFAPGRVELLGNHTDYNEGFVLLAALDRMVAVALKPRADRQVRLCSTTLNQTTVFALDQLAKDELHPWASYVKGVLDQLQRAGFYGCGADALIASNLPIGLGISSSAALEVSACLAFSQLWNFSMDRTEMAKLCQRAENEFVGVGCGILDQFSALFGNRQGAVFLDCRTLNHELVPLACERIAVVVADTGVKHALVAGQYNTRRRECQQGMQFFQSRRRQVSALRDVDPLEVDLHSQELDPVVLRRVRHIVEENLRVLAGAQALKEGNMAALGHYMRASHNSSRDLFQNTCTELDLLVDLAYRHPGVLGAKLSGGGFGGGTVNLVFASQVDDFTRKVTETYQQLLGVQPRLLACGIGDGAGIVPAPQCN